MKKADFTAWVVFSLVAGPAASATQKVDAGAIVAKSEPGSSRNPITLKAEAEAEAGDAAAQLALALMYEHGTDGLGQDYAMAYAWCSKSAAQQYAPAEYNLGLMMSWMVAPLSRDMANQTWGGGAEGWSSAMMFAARGEKCTSGESCSDSNRDRPGSIEMFRKAANRGYAPAQYVMGKICDFGGVGSYKIERDQAQAIAWWLKSAEQGCLPAQLCLAESYTRGNGMPSDFEKAKFWTLKAAAQGDAGAKACDLKALKAQVDLLNQLRAQALARANAGVAEAQDRVACDYFAGAGVARNPAEGLRWANLAIAGGSASAEYNLAKRYAAGAGVPLNEAEAVRLYRSAADKAVAPAQSELGRLYAEGHLGVPQDWVQAYARYDVAVTLGLSHDAGNRDQAGELLTPAQLQSAKVLAQKIRDALPETNPRDVEANRMVSEQASAQGKKKEA